MPRLLYLLTGVATAIPVIWALGWAVWGAGISVTEYLSLLGSLVLVASAAVNGSRQRLSARLALFGAMAIWSFYLPGMVGIVLSRLSDQELGLSVLLWTPSASPLTIVQPGQIPNFTDMRLTETEVRQIKQTGLTGTLSVRASNSKYGSGKKSHVILILQRPVSEVIDLKEPDATSIVYIQDRNQWKMFPMNARTLKRTIRIEPLADDPHQTSVMVELSTGARQGFGVWWPETELENRTR
jgi:hypothetical protein